MNAVKLFDLNMGKLPTSMPLLSLPDVILLPMAKLSLKVVDPKKITMIFKALAAGRMVMVVQACEPGKKPYQVGCAGRVSGFIEGDDDCLVLYLTGVCRGRILKQYAQDDMLMVDVSYDAFKEDFNDDAPMDMSEILFALDVYVQMKKLDIHSSLFRDLSAQRMLSAIISILPFSNVEKQALLEKETSQACAAALLTLLKMESIEEKEKGRC